MIAHHQREKRAQFFCAQQRRNFSFRIFGEKRLEHACDRIRFELVPEPQINGRKPEHLDRAVAIKIAYFRDAHSPRQTGGDNCTRARSAEILKVIGQDEIRVGRLFTQQLFDARKNFEREHAANSTAIQCEQSFHQLNLGNRKSVNHSKNSPAKRFSVFSTARRRLEKFSHFSI